MKLLGNVDPRDSTQALFSPAWVVCEEESVMSVWGSIIFYKETRTNHMLGRDTVGTDEGDGESVGCPQEWMKEWKSPQEWISHHALTLVWISSFRRYKGHFCSGSGMHVECVEHFTGYVYSCVTCCFMACEREKCAVLHKSCRNTKKITCLNNTIMSV